jgi:hypothetical protein
MGEGGVKGGRQGERTAVCQPWRGRQLQIGYAACQVKGYTFAKLCQRALWQASIQQWQAAAAAVAP